MESPLTNLSNILETVRASADSYEPYLRKEPTTRAVLIDPVLYALGWDIADPFMVEVEAEGAFRKNRIYADYGLKSDDEIIAVVEAKPLGANLTAEYDQLVGYSFGFKVNKMFLTDGIIWQHFDSTKFRPNNITPERTLNLRTDDLEEVAAYLVQELDAALVSPQRNQINLLSEQVNQLREEVEKLRYFERRLQNLEARSGLDQQQSTQDLGTKKRSASPKKWVSLSELSSVRGTKPSNLRLPDNAEISVKSWQQVLFECCNYALQLETCIENIPLLDSAGRKTNLIQAMPFPSNVNSRETEQNGKTYHIYVNYNAEYAARNALYVLSLPELDIDTTSAAVVYG